MQTTFAELKTLFTFFIPIDNNPLQIVTGQVQKHYPQDSMRACTVTSFLKGKLNCVFMLININYNTPFNILK